MNPSIRRRAVNAIAAAALVLLAQGAAAQSYPSKPIRLVVPFPPGGVADLLARPLAERMSAALGQPVVIENRAGATGTIAGAAVATAAADGYTLLFGTTNEIAMSPTLFKSLPYDPTRAFAPVSPVAEFPNVLVVGPQLGLASLQDLIAFARTNPGKLTFASSGTGSTNHLTAELFQQIAGVKVTHVPYKGGGPALADLLGGHVDAMFATLPSAMAHIRSGKLRALAVTGERRSPALPDVPTAGEAGARGLVVMTGNGVLAPAGTPAAVIERLQREVKAAIAVDAVRERYATAGAEPMTLTPEQFRDLIARDYGRWARLIKDNGISAE
ncbi:MAG: Bug family tripartite tricarboxylate transporter substrate binding protein [Betaproteobacteria bacterium]